ncbi:MAG: hypothetical protein O3C40_14895 [Planctomycetota bacterium]|nr:hypothetical protein [Planctomycetota bacterium]
MPIPISTIKVWVSLFAPPLRPSSPPLSLGKTIEGAIGGIAVACLASWVFFQFIAPKIVGASAAPSPLWGVLL